MRSKILTMIVGVCLAIGLVHPLQTQGSSKISSALARTRAMGLAPDPAEQAPGGQYPSQTLEDLRAELLNLADTVQDFVALAPAGLVDADSLQEARAQIQQMPYEQLNTLRQGISPSKLGSRLTLARQEIEAYSKTRAETKRSGLRPLVSDSTAFPVVSGFCDSIGNAVAGAIGGTPPGGSTVGPARIPVGVVLAADIVFFIADSVRELAQDACKQDVAGENTSLACTVVDIVWIVAKAVDEGIHFCQDDLTANVVDTNYARLDDVHSDLYSVGTTLDNHLTSANTDIDTGIANLDTHIANEFSALDAHLTALLSAVSNQVSSVQSSLDQANQRLLMLIAGQKEIMKLELTPEGLRQINPSILTCTGSNCPNVLASCPGGMCSWNNVGPLQ